MRQFNRAWRVQVGTLLLSERSAQGQTGLDCQFKVTRSLATARAGTCELTVFNLPAALSRELASLPRRTTIVSVDAGYVEGTSRLFTGDLRLATPSREGADLKMVVTAGDGIHARRTARVSHAFAPGTQVAVAAQLLADSMGVGVGNAATAFRGAQFQGGASVFEDGALMRGNAASELTRLCASASMEWSVQDGQLLVLPLGGALARTAIRIGADSGMIDSPQFVDRRTMKVKCLIQPGLVPGQRVVVDSILVDRPVLRITEVTSTGETAGQPWDAELTCKLPRPTLLDRNAPGETAVDTGVVSG